jgi:hypothetical protein
MSFATFKKGGERQQDLSGISIPKAAMAVSAAPRNREPDSSRNRPLLRLRVQYLPPPCGFGRLADCLVKLH